MRVACCVAGADGDAAEVTVWESPVLLQAALREDPSRFGGDDAVSWGIGRREVPTVADGLRRLAFLRGYGASVHAFSPRELREPLLVERVLLDDEEIHLLIAQLNAELFQRYPEPGALVFSLRPEDVVEGHGALLKAVLHGRPVACGAFKVLAHQPGTAEIKRMYVVPSARGQRIGAAVLDELEARARAIGITRFVIELGPRQPEAIHRYERAGYRACEPWGEFIGKELSICMAKEAG